MTSNNYWVRSNDCTATGTILTVNSDSYDLVEVFGQQLEPENGYKIALSHNIVAISASVNNTLKTAIIQKDIRYTIDGSFKRLYNNYLTTKNNTWSHYKIEGEKLTITSVLGHNLLDYHKTSDDVAYGLIREDSIYYLLVMSTMHYKRVRINLRSPVLLVTNTVAVIGKRELTPDVNVIFNLEQDCRSIHGTVFNIEDYSINALSEDGQTIAIKTSNGFFLLSSDGNSRTITTSYQDGLHFIDNKLFWRLPNNEIVSA